jgi:hypothetical protein
MAYGQPVGIDVYGKQVDASSFRAKRYIVFLLRFDHLQSDLDYWGRVGALLHAHKDIVLIGYCDSPLCADSIRKGPPLAFSVLEFGEATSILGVVNADTDGKAILKDVSPIMQSKILWRTGGNSPQQIVLEAIS